MLTRALPLACLLLLVAAAPAHAVRVFAVTIGTQPRLLSFDSAAPAIILTDVPVTGIGAGEGIEAIDLRPATGELLMLTSEGSTGRLYRLAPSGAASAPVTLAANPADLDNPFTGLSGPLISIDVNPTVDRVRAVGTDGLNLRINPNTGSTITDGAINPGTPAIVGVAYTNPFAGAISTTLYGYAYFSNHLVVLNPPNNGTIVDVGASQIVVSFQDATGLDITTNNAALLSARVAGSTGLYRLNLSTGAATFVGPIADGTRTIRDMTVAENLFRVSASPAAGGEGGAAFVSVVRDHPHGAATVEYSTAPGTAAAGSDYSPAAGTLSFAPGQTEQLVQVPLAADEEAEPVETLKFSLANPRGATAPEGSSATLWLPAAATVQIADSPDRDGDGRRDATDVCPNLADPAQADADGDGLGTACDPSEETPAMPGACANALAGTSADDLLRGGAAGDRLDGGAGADALLGAAGDDCLFGRSGHDYLAGGDGNDELRGGGGDDILRGGAGADRIGAGGGRNVVDGGDGNDRISAVNRVRETIRCGTGADRARVDRRDRLRGCERVTRRRR